MTETFPSPQRVLDAFEGRRPDRVGVFNQAVDPRIVSDVLGRACWTAGGESRWASLKAAMDGPQARRQFMRQYCRDIVQFALAVGEDMVRIGWWLNRPPNARYEGDRQVHWRSDDGTRFGRIVFDPDSGTTHEFNDWLAGLDGVERLIEWLDRQEADYQGPVQHSESDFAELAELAGEAAGRLALAESTGIVGIPMYEPAWLAAFAVAPERVGRHLARQADQAVADLPVVARLGVRVLNAGLDLCHNGGPAYSPRLFERYVLPNLRRVTEAAHALGLFYVYRTDGNTWPIGEMLFVTSGADGAGEIDYQAGMRLSEMRDAYPKLTLVGNLDCAGVLVAGTPTEVRRATLECLHATGGRRHLVSSSNMVMRGTPTANYLAMVEQTRAFEPVGAE